MTNKCFLHIVQFIGENIPFLLVIAQQIIMWWKKIHSFPKAETQVPVCFADVKNPLTLKEEEWEY